ncbi:MAG: hypothetical protein MUF14_11505 [Hyphomonadaceae bacterium]|nr:hypothetical protein [Hyphomonadaceae bacterium]
MIRTVTRRALLGPACALAVLVTACTRSPAATGTVATTSDATPLHDAVKQVNDVIVYDIFSPPQASRVFAYASIAAYEVLRQADSGYVSLAGQVRGLTPVPVAPPRGEVSLPLAGVHAYMVVGRALTFSQARMDTLRQAMDERFRGGLSEEVFETSVAYGDTVAAHILAWAGTDGFKQRTGLAKYSVLRDEPGRWIPTPPAYMDAVEPNWGTLRPFVMDTSNQFRPDPPFRPRRSPWCQRQDPHQLASGFSKVGFQDSNPAVTSAAAPTSSGQNSTAKLTPSRTINKPRLAAMRPHPDRRNHRGGRVLLRVAAFQ